MAKVLYKTCGEAKPYQDLGIEMSFETLNKLNCPKSNLGLTEEEKNLTEVLIPSKILAKEGYENMADFKAEYATSLFGSKDHINLFISHPEIKTSWDNYHKLEFRLELK